MHKTFLIPRKLQTFLALSTVSLREIYTLYALYSNYLRSIAYSKYPQVKIAVSLPFTFFLLLLFLFLLLLGLLKNLNILSIFAIPELFSLVVGCRCIVVLFYAVTATKVKN